MNQRQLCLHCQTQLTENQKNFCCLGCEAAHKIINGLGFADYYKLRQIKASERKLKPEIAEEFDVSEFIRNEKDGSFSLSLMIQGLHCAACVWLIESVLQRQENVVSARVNLSKKILFLRWKGEEENAAESGKKLIHLLFEIGYKLLPFDEEILKNSEKKYNDSILLALAVAGFGAGNIMLFSFSLWFADSLQMGDNTRNLLHFFSSLIALPVIIFSARPFFSSAWNSIRAGYPNMDLPVSIAIFLACVVSLLETFRSAEHVYFDSAVMLTFFLLIGRYLDIKARKKAFAIATEFSLLAASFGRVDDGGKLKIMPSKNLREGMILLVASGEKIAADGVVIDGESEIDSSLITGETLPKKIALNGEVFAGMINLVAPIRVRITKSAQNSLLAEIIRLSEGVEAHKSRYLRLADRLSRIYTPTVHLLAFLTFCGWYFLQNSGWELALMNATAVLIITCPCALALAVPIVQTIAISNFTRRGILIKSGEVLEKMREIQTFVFDKTGSLTLGTPSLREVFILRDNQKISLAVEQKNFYLSLAKSLAQKSRHPIATAISASYSGCVHELQVQENQGFGLSSTFENNSLKLGRKNFCDVRNDFIFDENSSTCFMKFGDEELVFIFEDELKQDAQALILLLQKHGKEVILLSGDNQKIVAATAKKLGIEKFYFEQIPVSKVEILQQFKSQNKKFAMIGDGLNDAPALALADVSISFSRATDIAQNVADVVIQGQKLMPIFDLINSSRRAIFLMKQNLWIALIYNLVAVPYAITGHVVPLFAALAMSSSSLLVLFNSLRMNQKLAEK